MPNPRSGPLPSACGPSGKCANTDSPKLKARHIDLKLPALLRHRTGQLPGGQVRQADWSTATRRARIRFAHVRTGKFVLYR
jgi:hypothetical protein